jgi:rubrerythrin
MDIEEAIQTSIEYETKVRDVYVEAANNATDPIGKRVFKVLVKEEQHHLKYLEQKLDELKNTGAVTTEGLETSIPAITAIEAEADKLKTKLEPSEGDRKYSDIELKMLKKALEVEIETSEFYNRMVDELPEEGKILFKRFVEIEEGHKAIVQAEIDAVTGMGYWFDMPEFDLAGN